MQILANSFQDQPGQILTTEHEESKLLTREWRDLWDYPAQTYMLQNKKYFCTSYARQRKDVSKIISFHFSNLCQKGKIEKKNF